MGRIGAFHGPPIQHIFGTCRFPVARRKSVVQDGFSRVACYNESSLRGQFRELSIVGEGESAKTFP